MTADQKKNWAALLPLASAFKPVELKHIKTLSEAWKIDVMVEALPTAVFTRHENELKIRFPDSKKAEEITLLLKEHGIHIDDPKQTLSVPHHSFVLTITDFESIKKLAVMGFRFPGAAILRQQESQLRMAQGAGAYL